MNKKTSESKDKRSGGMKPLKLLAIGLVVAAVVKELRLPQDQRTWHGSLAGFVPYDLRMPTLEPPRLGLTNSGGCHSGSRSRVASGAAGNTAEAAA